MILSRKRYLLAAALLAAAALSLVAAKSIITERERIAVTALAGGTSPPKLWERQCIDTVKFSRDRARAWLNNPQQFSTLINRQLSAVKDLGASCVAIGTPYDEEFVPFMALWTDQARQHGLSVWFRGNFAGWEGWFDYPELTGAQQHHNKTSAFISGHPGLFADGDIFTPAPEAENGILGNPFASEENKNALLAFLSASYANCETAFARINKKVSCGHFSVSGDVAEKILTAQTVRQTGSLVAIDHYVSNAQQMSEDLDKLYGQYRTKLILGEFGAPIPDINGPMDESQQAALVKELLHVFYSRRNILEGLNYWVLEGGTTSLLRDDGSYRPVASILQNYYKPALVRGRVTNTLNQPIEGAAVGITEGDRAAITDHEGYFAFPVPAGTTTLFVHANGHKPERKAVILAQHGTYSADARLQPVSPNAGYLLRYIVTVLFA